MREQLSIRGQRCLQTQHTPGPDTQRKGGSLLISRWHLISKHSSFHHVSPFMWCSCRLNTLRTNALLLANTEPRYRTSDFPKLDPTETFLSTRFDQSTHCHNYLEHWEPKYTMGKKKGSCNKTHVGVQCSV